MRSSVPPVFTSVDVLRNVAASERSVSRSGMDIYARKRNDRHSTAGLGARGSHRDVRDSERRWARRSREPPLALRGARNLRWVQASLDQKQRLQQLFFPEGVAFDGTVFNRTATTAPFFRYFAPSE